MDCLNHFIAHSWKSRGTPENAGVGAGTLKNKLEQPNSIRILCFSGSRLVGALSYWSVVGFSKPRVRSTESETHEIKDYATFEGLMSRETLRFRPSTEITQKTVEISWIGRHCQVGKGKHTSAVTCEHHIYAIHAVVLQVSHLLPHESLCSPQDCQLRQYIQANV